MQEENKHIRLKKCKYLPDIFLVINITYQIYVPQRSHWFLLYWKVNNKKFLKITPKYYTYSSDSCFDTGTSSETSESSAVIAEIFNQLKSAGWNFDSLKENTTLIA